MTDEQAIAVLGNGVARALAVDNTTAALELERAANVLHLEGEHTILTSQRHSPMSKPQARNLARILVA